VKPTTWKVEPNDARRRRGRPGLARRDPLGEPEERLRSDGAELLHERRRHDLVGRQVDHPTTLDLDNPPTLQEAEVELAELRKAADTLSLIMSHCSSDSAYRIYDAKQSETIKKIVALETKFPSLKTRGA
jgi:hypothetical protein